MFHYNSVAGIGYSFFIPSFFIYKAIKFYKGEELQKMKWEEGDEESYASLPEFIIRAALIGMIDYMCSSFIPINIFGTKNLHMQFDFMIKKCLFTLTLCFVVNSKHIEETLRLWLRPNI